MKLSEVVKRFEDSGLELSTCGFYKSQDGWIISVNARSLHEAASVGVYHNLRKKEDLEELFPQIIEELKDKVSGKWFKDKKEKYGIVSKSFGKSTRELMEELGL